MKKTIAICLITYLLFSVLLPSAALYAQWYNPDNVNKKAAAFYANAYKDAQDCNYTQAKENVNKALAVDAKFVDAYLTRAGIFANEKKYDSSVADFENSLAVRFRLQRYLPATLLHFPCRYRAV